MGGLSRSSGPPLQGLPPGGGIALPPEELQRMQLEIQRLAATAQINNISLTLAVQTLGTHHFKDILDLDSVLEDRVTTDILERAERFFEYLTKEREQPNADA